jgi:hypothetical protein
MANRLLSASFTNRRLPSCVSPSSMANINFRISVTGALRSYFKRQRYVSLFLFFVETVHSLPFIFIAQPNLRV